MCRFTVREKDLQSVEVPTACGDEYPIASVTVQELVSKKYEDT